MTDTRTIPELADALNAKFNELFQGWRKMYTVEAEIRLSTEVPAYKGTMPSDWYLCFSPESGFQVRHKDRKELNPLASASLEVRIRAVYELSKLEGDLKLAQSKAYNEGQQLLKAVLALGDIVARAKRE